MDVKTCHHVILYEFVPPSDPQAVPILVGLGVDELSCSIPAIPAVKAMVRRFDLARETRFASYAGWWVRACVRRYALANRRIVGVPSTRGARIARARVALVPSPR